MTTQTFLIYDDKFQFHMHAQRQIERKKYSETMVRTTKWIHQKDEHVSNSEAELIDFTKH